MAKLSIAKDIYWVGVIDWNVRNFHGHTYTTKRGTTYNAYLIIDEKVALVDTVYGPFASEMIERIREIIPPEKIDFIIANHVETDHSGALVEILKFCPKAEVIGTAKCKEGLYRNYYGDWKFRTVKTNDRLKLGNKNLLFIEAPMIHWPDSMFTYLIEDQILMPNDAFGQHYATSARFDDQVDQFLLMDEAEKYYANILWPLGTVISKKINELLALKLPIKIIAPSHGVIWRKEPMKIINAYLSWVKNIPEDKAVVLYETMWTATEKMAIKIAEGIAQSGIDVKVYDVTKIDRTELVKEMFEAKGYVLGSSTHDNEMLPNIAGFLHFLKGLKPKNRIGCAFGSFGWAGGAIKNLEDFLKEAEIEIVQSSLGIKYFPDDSEVKSCYEFGLNFGERIKQSR